MTNNLTRKERRSNINSMRSLIYDATKEEMFRMIIDLLEDMINQDCNGHDLHYFGDYTRKCSTCGDLIPLDPETKDLKYEESTQ